MMATRVPSFTTTAGIRLSLPIWPESPHTLILYCG